ncbi:MAG TPA: hypothetical protein VG819_10290 [Rhizomicrobium sp.]|jgi:hypothetical protein|nr:hypothetical protein [Rhizomicrobium sp.]
MSIADIQARALAKMAGSAGRSRKTYFAAVDKARREANLRAEGWVVPISEWLGHNNGPDWFNEVWLDYSWRKAHEKAWAPPSQEIGIRRARKAEALGMSYRDYVLEILERGRYPQGKAH